MVLMIKCLKLELNVLSLDIGVTGGMYRWSTNQLLICNVEPETLD